MRRLLPCSRLLNGTTRPTIAPLVVLTAVLVPFAWCFGPVLLFDRTLAFRDAGNFYYSLFEWQSDEWSAGRVPLWNPHDNCGTAVVGDATSSVFYPGKLLFVLPLSFTRCYNLYLSLHVLLAAATAYALAQRFGASPAAAGLSGVSYAFGGTVLFQYCNVVFLIGAAWLPLACLAADRMIAERAIGWALALSSILALMVLGGDPQMAYHTGLMVALLAWLDFRAAAHDRNQPSLGRADEHSGRDLADGASSDEHSEAAPKRLATSRDELRPSGWFRARTALLAISAVTAILLSAVQVAPSVVGTGASNRAASRTPRTAYELAGQLITRDRESPQSGPAAYRGLLGNPAPGTHHASIYEFSVGPWRFIELLWPNCYGRPFPQNRRWITALPAEGRVWTPSMYLGLLPLVLGLRGWSLTAQCRRRVWLSWCVLLAGLASLGGYGLVWAMHEIRFDLFGAEPQDTMLGRSVGGLYWLMVVMLPGYVYFRYPAKLLVVAALGTSLLAAGQWDRCAQRSYKFRCPQFIPVIAFTSLVIACGAMIGQSFWTSWIEQAPRDLIFGPLDGQGAFQDLLGGLLQTTLVAGICWFAFSRLVRSRTSAGYVAVLVTAIDLILANGWMTRSIPSKVWLNPPAVAQQIMAAQHILPRHAARVFRASPSWVPHKWSLSTSSNRLRDVVAWEHDSVLPKHHLRGDLSLVESFATLRVADLTTLLRIARRYGPSRPDGSLEPSRHILDALSAEFLVLPATTDVSASGLVELPPKQLPENVKLCWNPHCFPKAWLVHRIQVVPALRSNDPSIAAARTRQVLGSTASPRDFRHEAVLETDQPINPTTAELEKTSQTTEVCQLVSYGPQRIVLNVTLHTAGCVVVNDSFDPGWRVWIRSGGGQQAGTIHRANRVMRAVLLPAGEHRLEFRYQPRLFYGAAVCSLFTWLVVFCCWYRWGGSNQ